MRSLMISAPWGIENIRFIDVPQPVPGPGEVRLRMKAVAINYRDLLIASGRHVNGALAQQEIVPFGDGCGIVDAVGEGVTRVSVGDRVIPMLIPNWVSGPPTPETVAKALGKDFPGTGREYMVVSEENLVKAPECLTDVEAACLAIAGLTAWAALFDGPKLVPGNVVLIQGTGGVSMFALQFAKAAGLQTIITSSSDEKLERAREYGADHLINYRMEKSWSGAGRRLTGGLGPDFILDMGGEGTLEESLRAVRMNGYISVVGLVGGVGSVVNPTSMLASCAHVKGVLGVSRNTFEDMCRAISFHRIRPVISEVMPWTEVRTAMEALQSGAHFGKIVLEIQ
ncbi:zinc-dependent alcohol dehydrogenase family protein [Sphingobium subterraneum]|uniref:NADPH:quinone reductase-like Zn-dependent oxidoreductase n=1 Tax=Sphingobium subterraneum TaxID=627688 RepID=A0A841J6T3_9SPHN|nr:NAD(P)-dependent alcohol dehydrogenase [Sphingobium subterraneum]MBB6125236.1 NADPH:quinone reductase-like Zn-dependent oxidoreductase [Sphingobium subterraneum]